MFLFVVLDDDMYKDDLVDTNCLLERGYEIDGEDQRYDDPDYDTRIREYLGGGQDSEYLDSERELWVPGR